MPHLSTQGPRSTPGRRSAVAVALPILLLACGGLTACGSSSSSPSTTAANAAAGVERRSATGSGASGRHDRLEPRRLGHHDAGRSGGARRAPAGVLALALPPFGNAFARTA